MPQLRHWQNSNSQTMLIVPVGRAKQLYPKAGSMKCKHPSRFVEPKGKGQCEEWCTLCGSFRYLDGSPWQKPKLWRYFGPLRTWPAGSWLRKAVGVLFCLLCFGCRLATPDFKTDPRFTNQVARPPEIPSTTIQHHEQRAVAALIVPTSRITVTATTDANASLLQHMEFGLESSTNMVNWTRIMLAPEPSFTVLVNKPREFYRMEWHWK